MSEGFRPWERAVLDVYEHHRGKPIRLKTVYEEVGNYTKLTDWDLWITPFGEPRYENTVRRVHTDLVRKGYISRVGWGVYIFVMRPAKWRDQI